MLLMKLTIQSLQRATKVDIASLDYESSMLAEIKGLNEIRLGILSHLLAHKNKVERAYHKLNLIFEVRWKMMKLEA